MSQTRTREEGMGLMWIVSRKHTDNLEFVISLLLAPLLHK